MAMIFFSSSVRFSRRTGFISGLLKYDMYLLVIVSKSYALAVARHCSESDCNLWSSDNNFLISLTNEFELFVSFIIMPFWLFLIYSFMPIESETTGTQPVAMASRAVRPKPSEREAST